MKSYLFLFLGILLLTCSCYNSNKTPEMTEESVMICEVPITGRVTEWHPVNPNSEPAISFEEKFDSIFSKDHTLMHMSTHIYLRPVEGKSSTLVKNYGEDWYDDFLRKKCRDIIECTVAGLDQNQIAPEKLDRLIEENIKALLKSMSSQKELPLEVVTVWTSFLYPLHSY